MTDLNKLLYVAQKVWSDDEAVIKTDLSTGDKSIYLVNAGICVEPHKTTERGKAQLMDIVFSLSSSDVDFDAHELMACLYDKNAEAIINLAAEVL